MDLEKLFSDLGYTKEEYKKIRNNYSVVRTTDEVFYNNVIEHYKWFLDLGYTKKEIKKLIKFLPAICCLNLENLNQKVEDLISLGYSKNDVIKMIKKFSSIFSINIDTIKQKIKKIKELGYTENEVLSMIRIFPVILSLDVENIKQKNKDLENLGYNLDEVKKITVTFPQVYSLGSDNITQKVEFYDSIDLHDMIVETPRNLIQSVNVSYARYKFFQKKGINITMVNYKKIFTYNKQFEAQYKITKETLLEKYNYEESKKMLKVYKIIEVL